MGFKTALLMVPLTLIDCTINSIKSFKLIKNNFRHLIRTIVNSVKSWGKDRFSLAIWILVIFSRKSLILLNYLRSIVKNDFDFIYLK